MGLSQPATVKPPKCPKPWCRSSMVQVDGKWTCYPCDDDARRIATLKLSGYRRAER